MLEHGSTSLAKIHADANRKKHFCYLTGYLEGVGASGHLEPGEIDPLVAVCGEYFLTLRDPDAGDIFQDFEADLLEAETIHLLVDERRKHIDGACPKSSVNRFLGFCAGIACDGSLLDAEIRGIVERGASLGSDAYRPGIREVLNTAADALRDGVVTAEERGAIANAIARLVGDCYADTGITEISSPVSLDEDRIEDFPDGLAGVVVVLTGEFQARPRSGFEKRLTALGATIESRVTGRTDILVVGGKASRDWLETNRGHKIIRALELRDTGATPRPVSEQQLLNLMDQN